MLATSIRQPGLVPAVLDYVQLELRPRSRNRRYLMTAVIFPVMFYALFTGVLQGGGPIRRPVAAWSGRPTTWSRWRPTAPSAPPSAARS